MASEDRLLNTTQRILDLLRLLNIAAAALLVGALILSFVAPQPSLQAIAGEIGDGKELDYLRTIRMLFGLGAAMAIPVHLIFSALLRILRGARSGDPFTAQAARSLRTTAWLFLLLQVADLYYGYVAIRFSLSSGEYAGWSPGLTGWLAVLLLFVLARIFEQGAALREEVEGTI
ncbi:hypothetical protein B5C34_02915 [Pacificimonas flava]|uniref:DUF2975 domain-containing protein n=2 Tax=Pacificimonas TaxID=1960290 RepID=A0A219B2Y0_9SPHN|nr:MULTISPECIES: DUF2975 domain-containing protein [Pacificimonas]MBZ6377828.1 DUF2975 domain-containing protein [Pacificimonas aurantium]OWV32506.1 hypothetical protein B5C34_02915 [Pacificimonas flava]